MIWSIVTAIRMLRILVNEIDNPEDGEDGMSRAAMKKTAVMFLYDVELHEWVEYGEITCEVRGEMADGTKVWVDLVTEEQYFLFRYGRNNYYFVHA